MKHRIAFQLLPFIIALTLLAAFMITAPVFAQDEIPPEAPVPTETAPVVEETQVPPPPPPVVVTPVEEVAVCTVIQDLAEAGVALADGEGQLIPFASEKALEALTLPDPWFKIGTTTYNYVNIQDAVDAIAGGLHPSDGFIHVDAGTLPNQKVTIDGSDPDIVYLKGIVGIVNKDTFTPDSILSFTDGTSGSWIAVSNKMNGFTISGLDVSGNTSSVAGWGVVDFVDSAGAILLQDLVANNNWGSGSGIRITNHNGIVTLKNVDSSDNAGGGAYIDNTTGTAGVIVTNSSFDDNQSTGFSYPVAGLHIKTKSAVSISGVSASRNLGAHPGFWIEGGTTVTIKSSEVVSNSNGRGIDIQTPTGAVSLTNVLADSNGFSGIYIRNKGAITLNSVEASGNFNAGAYGADLNNTSSTSSVGVTVTNSVFSDNYTTGLLIYTKSNIVLTNVASQSNDGAAGSSGADLDNMAGTGYVKITNLPSTDENMKPGFDTNHDRGVNIHTRGTVTLTNVNMINNQEEGIYVWQDYNKGVTMTNCRVDGNGTSFGTAGILINSLGPITISGGHANGNSFWGVRVHNEAAPDSAPKPITISNFTANSNWQYGFFVESKGAIKLTNVTADYTSHANGAAIKLDNSWLNAGITLNNVTTYDNNNIGIDINTKGAISLTKLAATWNGNIGAYINQIAAASGFPSTTITTGDFTHNASSGLALYGRGAINLKDITANSNGWTGAYITNVNGNVTLSASSTGGNSFNYNVSHDGLDINTQGSVTLNKVTASYNTGATGVYLYYYNSGYFPVGSVIINGGSFNGSGGYPQAQGLIVLSKNTITVNDLVAEGNVNDGITLTNISDTTGAKGITANRTRVIANGGSGLVVTSYGVITINTVDARVNADNGVNLNNAYGAFPTPKGISVLGSYGSGSIIENNSTGLFIRSYGNVVVSKLSASFNSNHGIDISNFSGKGTVSLSYVTANSNAHRGILIYSNNAVTASYITALYNSNGTTWSALYIDTNSHNLTISNSLISGNGYYGVWGVMGATGIFKITNSFYFGNCTFIGSYNIYITH
jgi:hypothetical protein